MSGQTLVNIQIEESKYNKIPSITICYPRLLSMKQVADVYPVTYGEQYNAYLDTMRSIADGDISYENSTMVSHLNRLYDGNVSGLINEGNRLRDLFDLSIPYHYGDKNSSLFNKGKLTEFGIDIHVKGIRLFYKNMTLNVIEVKDTDPIESVVLPDGRQGSKCFTFFSQMKPKWREYQIDLKVMHINIYQHESWFPPSLYDGSAHVYLSMHSPNIMPQQMSSNNFIRLQAGKWYEMTYNRWKTILLPPGYDTKCRDYRLSSTKSGDQLRADCVNQCIYDGLVKHCDHDKQAAQHGQDPLCLYRSDILWRKDLVESGALLDNNRICAKYDPGTVNAHLADERTVYRRVCLQSHALRVNGECELKCPQECNNRYYNYNVKTSDKMDAHSPWTKQTHVRMAHNQMPQQITEHIPEISFVQYIGTVGGLMGMWVVICSAIMVYQVIDITVQYMSGQTLVNIKVAEVKYNKIPAITICYPRLLSMKRVAETFPDLYGKQYATYLDRMQSIADGDISYENSTVVSHLNDLYDSNVSGLIYKEHRLSDLFDLSIPFHYDKNSSIFNKNKLTEFAIDIRLKGVRMLYENRTLNLIEITDTDPIESIVLPDRRQGFKCFTFFSQLKPKWMEYKI
ncbi:unnamed protein product, partial [Medioppia subpectinata]